jgi:hypothetical protein
VRDGDRIAAAQNPRKTEHFGDRAAFLVSRRTTANRELTLHKTPDERRTQMIRKMNGTLHILSALILALPISAVALAQGANEYGEEPEQQADVIQTVARVSYLDGSASYARGDEPDDWQQADVNVPVTLGDRIYTNDHSRLELRVHGGDSIWAGANTDLSALNLTEDTKQFALKAGVASFRVRQMDDNDVWEVDTPNAAVNFEGAGDYRIRVDQDGNTRVSVDRGNLTVAAGGGQIGVKSGEEIVIDGTDSPRYDFVSSTPPDAWDHWVEGRNGRIQNSASYHYVNPSVVGAEDLDQYGSWSNVPQYGMAWSPTRVEAGWAPYRAGHWIWQDPWGWTWVSSEAWGWAPYHSGRWVNYSSRWFWVPVAPAVRVAYAPALVAFVGAGPGFAASVTVGGPGYVGWFPLAPREPFVPWWSPRPAAVNVNVANVTYVNQTYVTVVNQNTFVSGGLVARNVVTDRSVVRQVQTTQVVHGAIPVLPTLASTRVSVRAGAAAVVRPPAAVVARTVVARVAPPPAPPRFQQKLAVIQENKRPVDPVAAARLTTQAQAQPRSTVAVRPVATAGGNVTLTQRQGASTATAGRARPAPAPVAAGAVRGRAAATAQQPVANEPVSARKIGERPAPARPQPPASQGAPAPAEAGRAPGQPAPPTRPAAQVERERQIEARPTPRPAIERQAAPPAERQAAPQSPEARTRQEAERPPTPNWRERSRPTPKEAVQPPRENQPSREATPDRGQAQRDRAQAELERERAQTQQQQRERAQAQQERERSQAQSERAQPQRPEAQPSREEARPQETEKRKEAEQPQAQRGRPTPKPKPKPTPQKDEKPD